MFSQKLWDFKQGQERVGRCIWGITVGCVVGMLWVVGVVLGKGKDWGRDPLGWAWIDVVRVAEMYGKSSMAYKSLIHGEF